MAGVYDPVSRTYKIEGWEKNHPSAEVYSPVDVQMEMDTGGKPSSIYSRLYNEGMKSGKKLSNEDIAKWTKARQSEYQDDYTANKQKAIEKAGAAERARLGEGVRIDYNKLGQKAGREYEYDNPNENDLEVLARALGRPVDKLRDEMKAFDIMQKQGTEIAIRKNDAEQEITDAKGGATTPAQGGTLQKLNVKDPTTGKMTPIEGLKVGVGPDGSVDILDRSGNFKSYKKGEWNESGEVAPTVGKPKPVAPVIDSVDSIQMPGSKGLNLKGKDATDAQGSYEQVYAATVKELNRLYFSKGKKPTLNDVKYLFNVHVNQLTAQLTKDGYQKVSWLKKLLLDRSSDISVR